MPQPNTSTAQPVSMAVYPRSAQRSLVKVEAGINGSPSHFVGPSHLFRFSLD
jgi:hypothetical protein